MAKEGLNTELDTAKQDRNTETTECKGMKEWSTFDSGGPLGACWRTEDCEPERRSSGFGVDHT